MCSQNARLNAIEVEVELYSGNGPGRLFRTFAAMPKMLTCWRELFHTLYEELCRIVPNHEGSTASDTALFISVIPCRVDDLSKYEVIDLQGGISIHTVRFTEDALPVGEGD